MRNTSSRVRSAIAVAVLGLIGVAIGCGDNGNPVRPTSVSAEQTAGGVRGAGDAPVLSDLKFHCSSIGQPPDPSGPDQPRVDLFRANSQSNRLQ